MDTKQPQVLHPGRLAYYHATRTGHGSALRLEMRLNQYPGDRYDCLFLELANQKSTASKNSPATFDWEQKMIVKLDFHDCTKLLAVLKGLTTSAGGEKGLYHAHGDAGTRIVFRTRDEGGWGLALSKRDRQGQQLGKSHILLNPEEGLGLAVVLEASLLHLAFRGSFSSPGLRLVRDQPDSDQTPVRRAG